VSAVLEARRNSTTFQPPYREGNEIARVLCLLQYIGTAFADWVN
jgi:hypothetical protein